MTRCAPTSAYLQRPITIIYRIQHSRLLLLLRRLRLGRDGHVKLGHLTERAMDDPLYFYRTHQRQAETGACPVGAGERCAQSLNQQRRLIGARKDGLVALWTPVCALVITLRTREDTVVYFWHLRQAEYGMPHRYPAGAVFGGMRRAQSSTHGQW